MKEIIKNHKGYQKDIMSFLGNNFPNHTADQIKTFTQHCPHCNAKFAIKGAEDAFCTDCLVEFNTNMEILAVWQSRFNSYIPERAERA